MDTPARAEVIVGVGRTDGKPMEAPPPTASPAARAAYEAQRAAQAAAEAERQQKEAFRQAWVPAFLQYDLDLSFHAESRLDITDLNTASAVITALAAAPGKNLVIFAVTDASGSRLLEKRLPEEGLRPVADAAALGANLWFHGGMSLSPHAAWLLATAGERPDGLYEKLRDALRGAAARPGDTPGDLWLIDSTGAQPARRVVQAGRLASCTWSPSGRYALCEWRRDGKDALAALLLEAETGETHQLTEGRVAAAWSADSTRLTLYRIGGTQGESLAYDPAHPELAPERGTSPVVSDQTLCSQDSPAAAWVVPGTEQQDLEVREAPGRTRTDHVAAGIHRLLGWSLGGKLLAFVREDGRLGFAVGGASGGAAAKKWQSVLPLPHTPGHRSGGTVSDKCPVVVASPDRLLAAWGTLEGGPCLVYVAAKEQGEQTAGAVSFEPHSATRDERYDLNRDLREQVIAMKAQDTLGEIWNACSSYASDHGGKLPDCDTSEELAVALKGYYDPWFMEPPYTRGVFWGRLLAKSQDFMDLRVKCAADHDLARRTPFAEVRSEEGYVFVMYMDNRIDQTAPTFREIEPSPFSLAQ